MHRDETCRRRNNNCDQGSNKESNLILPPERTNDRKPELRPGGVHLWTVSLDPARQNGTTETILSLDELERASRFRFPEHRARYAEARYALRSILGLYSGCDPGSVRFEYGPHGKPELSCDGPLRFNLSHSGDLALVGLTLDSAIGVDVEHIRRVAELDGIARRFFRPEEADAVLARPDRDQTRAFFRIWTRKEALLKLTGEGLQRRLNSLISTDTEAEHLHVIPGHAIIGVADPVCVHHIDLGPEYVGAVAYWGPPRHLSLFDWKRY